MRLSYKEEDEKWLEAQRLRTLSKTQLSKMPREVLADGWDEDPNMYDQKRKP